MKLSDDTIGRFQKCWYEQYQEELPVEKAREYAGAVLDLVTIAHRRIAHKKVEPP